MARRRKEREIIEALKEIGMTRFRLKKAFSQMLKSNDRNFNKFLKEDAILKYEESQLVRDLERMK